MLGLMIGTGCIHGVFGNVFRLEDKHSIVQLMTMEGLIWFACLFKSRVVLALNDYPSLAPSYRRSIIY